jgi:hypothetical protein
MTYFILSVFIVSLLEGSTLMSVELPHVGRSVDRSPATWLRPAKRKYSIGEIPAEADVPSSSAL